MSAVPAAAGIAIDQLLGEPPVRWHPVVGYGAVMTAAERRLYADRRGNGIAFTALGVGVGISSGIVLRKLVGARVATVIATTVCAAGKMLDAEAGAVQQLLAAGDLAAARQRVRALVGRRTDELSEAEVSRAVIESVAENSVDAVVASLFWATVAGAPAVLAHRAVNTLDAMVGHHNERYEHFGWASARLDDVVNYVPARLAALAAVVSRPQRAGAIWRTVRRDAGQHPSPNGGVIEAAYAAALGVTLGGSNRYGDTVEDRGTLGDGPPATAASITAAIRLRRRCIIALALLGAACSWRRRR